MKFFLDFLHQKVPRDRGEIPAYYSRALTAGEILQAVYFLVCFFLYPLINSRWEWIPILFIAATGLGHGTLPLGGETCKRADKPDPVCCHLLRVGFLECPAFRLEQRCAAFPDADGRAGVFQRIR